MTSAARRPSPEDGFSLIEVLMALALVAITMAAMGPFFVSGFQRVSQQRGQQAGVQLADSAMEQVRALKGSSLLTGRGEAASRAQWNLGAANVTVKPYLDTMQLAWDTLVKDTNAGSVAAISTASQTMTISNTLYTRSIFVGICDVYVGGAGDCVDPTKVAPPADSTKDLKFFRAVVLVTWPDKNCTTGTCTYVTSTLVARASEPTFDVHRPAPVVKTKTVYFYRGVAGSFQMDASGGQLPNTWTISSVPAGLTMTPAGVISGTPTAIVGVYTVMATVTDKLGRSDTETVTIQIVLPPALTVPSNPRNHVGETVSQQLTTTGGVLPYTYVATGLPAGLTLNKDTGAITGVVTTVGVYSVSVTATDDNGGKATGTYTHTVYPALTISPIADQTISLGNTVTATASAQGGDNSYTYSATGLPTATTINASTGVISGVPVVPGRYLPTVTVTDGLGGKASTTFVLLVQTTTQLIFTSPSLAAPDQTTAAGAPVNLKIGDNSSALGLKPTLAVSGLPPGLTANLLSGTISGKPTTPGTYTVTALATNLTPPQTSVLTFVWTIT